MRGFDVERAWLWCAALLLSLVLLFAGYPVLAPIVRPSLPPAPVSAPAGSGGTDGCGHGMITLSSPLDEQAVQFPLRIAGTVDNAGHAVGCRWIIYEGEAGSAILLDAAGREIGSAILTAQGDWMAPGPVAFSATLTPTSEPAKGRLVLRLSDNNADDQAKARQLKVPLVYGSRCDIRPDPGSCKAVFSKFYFDAEAGQCSQFLWGGCGGDVPFGTLSACEASCER